jgi:DNA-directed RNA polymerase sigma subunit (sigma70/sigma32)
MPAYTLKQVAENGYVMGLPTIGEVAHHMESHYDAYFLIENFAAEMSEFEAMIEGHEEESIFKHLTDADKVRLDDELEKSMDNSPDELPDIPEDSDR